MPSRLPHTDARYAPYGFRAQDMPTVWQFEEFAAKQGLSDIVVHEILDWQRHVAPLRSSGAMSHQDMLDDFVLRCDEIGLGDAKITAVLDWHNGGGSRVEHPENELRMEEIRNLRRTDPHAYEKNRKALEAEEIALIEASLGRKPAASPAVSQVDARLQEISRLRRDSPNDYAAQRQALEREEIGLLDGQIQQRRAAEAAAETSSQQPAAAPAASAQPPAPSSTAE